MGESCEGHFQKVTFLLSAWLKILYDDAHVNVVSTFGTPLWENCLTLVHGCQQRRHQDLGQWLFFLLFMWIGPEITEKSGIWPGLVPIQKPPHSSELLYMFVLNVCDVLQNTNNLSFSPSYRLAPNLSRTRAATDKCFNPFYDPCLALPVFSGSWLDSATRRRPSSSHEKHLTLHLIKCNKYAQRFTSHGNDLTDH